MLSKLVPPSHLDVKVNSLQVPPGPPSPTNSTSSFISSVSWMAEKTTSELVPLLKNAYSALKDKEKDLMLAAELGKSLLEHNMKLKSSYDSLLKLSTPPVTPSSSTNTVQETTHLVLETNDDDDMQFIPSRTTREAMLEVLEHKNTELTSKLEKAMLEQESLSRSNLEKTRQLENEISLLKSNLDIASSKILELQEMNSKQKKIEIAASAVDVANDDLVDELYTEIHKIQDERDAVLQSKQDIESKLSNTLKDLGNLKKQFEKFEFTQQDFDRLQEAYESQYDHIQELNQSLEEHRTVLQKLKDRGINVHASPTPSTYDFSDEEDSQMYRKNTLLQELEIGWMKSNSNPSTKSHVVLAASPLSTSPSDDMFHLRNFKEQPVHCAPSIGFESVLSKATGIDQKLLDETLDFINKIEQEHNKEKCMALYHNFTDNDSFSIADNEYPCMDLYPNASLITTALGQLQLHGEEEPTSLSERVKRHIRSLFNLIWKWCRFAIILTTALLINAWKGPDALLLTY